MWWLCADSRVEFQLWQVWSSYTAPWFQSLFCTRSGKDRLGFWSCCTMNIAGVQLHLQHPQFVLITAALRRGEELISHVVLGSYF